MSDRAPTARDKVDEVAELEAALNDAIRSSLPAPATAPAPDPVPAPQRARATTQRPLANGSESRLPAVRRLDTSPPAPRGPHTAPRAATAGETPQRPGMGPLPTTPSADAGLFADRPASWLMADESSRVVPDDAGRSVNP